ncbi:MAG TPA: magnesium transporter [Actinomycetota bacterium]|jgi:mgtE-like transporter|nr:magnesium transporter [Actinomycetota bacterium]
MRRGLRRILAYWRAEQRTIIQGFVALLISSLGSLVAGMALGSITGTLDALPGLIVMIPAAIGMRGNIFGALGSRLGTSIHAGLYEPTRRREGILYQNIFAVTVLTFVISWLLGILARAISGVFGVESISALSFVVISIVGGVLSSIVVGGFTVALSIWAHRRGWDLDAVAAPLVTAAGDAVTIPSLFLATFLVGIRWVTPALAAVLTLVTAYVAVRSLLTDLPLAKRVLRESIPILAVAGAVDILAGLFVEVRLERFLVYPALLVLIPPFLEGAGALGGVLTSRLASKLHLGVMSPRGRPEAVALLDTSVVFLFALVNFSLTGIAADAAAGLLGLRSPGALTLMGITLLAGLMATVLTVVVAYYSAIATFRMGLDPDNHGIPMITSTMDLVGVVTIVIALLAFGIA